MKIICVFLLIALLLQPAFAQTETFDILHYTPPKDFKKKINLAGLLILMQMTAQASFVPS